ncbi:MAG: 3-oxoacyl-[acyl-carrier-protein] reductase [Flavobacteriales bacterium]|nr:3-oxoacyl-[acyl-carrier-protein] reductase [Flavobacteriales bacterium]|tara:strand:+ start:2258 stop:3004 length:747 start_codon:yes stop_codon:yes gene_type:complete
MKLLENKTIVVTGGSRGIGKSIVLKLAENGANVIFTYLSSSEKANMVIEEAQKYGVSIEAFKSDASNYEDCQKLIANILSKHVSIDVLVNNAGVTKDNLLLRMSEQDFNSVLSVNMNSVFNMTKAVQKSMLKSRNGCIINLSSVVGLKGNAGQANYAASKSAIIGFSKSVALELGSRNIRCNVIAPGYIETEMTQKLDNKTADLWKQSIPLKRAGVGDDVANLIVFLSSEMASYITGQVISVCGGLST